MPSRSRSFAGSPSLVTVIVSVMTAGFFVASMVRIWPCEKTLSVTA